MVFSGFSPIFGTNLLTKAYISYVVPPLWIIALRRKTASKFSWFSAEVLFCLAFLALGALIVDWVRFWATRAVRFSGFQKSSGFQSTIISHNGFCFWHYLQSRACAYRYRSSHYPRHLSVCLWNICGHHWAGERGMKAFFFLELVHCGLYRKSTKSYVGARIPCTERMFEQGCWHASSFCGDDCPQPVKTTTVWRRGCLLASWEQWNTDFCALEAR